MFYFPPDTSWVINPHKKRRGWKRNPNRHDGYNAPGSCRPAKEQKRRGGKAHNAKRSR